MLHAVFRFIYFSRGIKQHRSNAVYLHALVFYYAIRVTITDLSFFLTTRSREYIGRTRLVHRAGIIFISLSG